MYYTLARQIRFSAPQQKLHGSFCQLTWFLKESKRLRNLFLYVRLDYLIAVQV